METSSWVTLTILVITMLSFVLVAWLRRRGDGADADLVEKIEPVVVDAVKKIGEQQKAAKAIRPPANDATRATTPDGPGDQGSL